MKEVLIKIPEDEYHNILLTGKASFCVVNAIEAGTLLPKGHGRLIDADDVNNHIIGFVDLSSCPTIIEADKKAERTLLDVVAEWNKAIEKNGYIN